MHTSTPPCVKNGTQVMPRPVAAQEERIRTGTGGRTMILQDSILIKASPEAIFRFFEEMERNYLQWHPDHVLYRWVSGRGVKVGHVFYFEEYIAGKLFKKRVVFTRVVPHQHIEFAPTFWLMKLFLPRMVFRIEPEGNGCRFVAEVHLRMGPLAQRAHTQEFAAIREHMRVEGLNIKRILEQQAPHAAASRAGAIGVPPAKKHPLG